MHRHLNQPRLVLIVLSVLGGLVIVYATGKYGPGLSPDSVNYIATAENLAAGEGYLQLDKRPAPYKPPLYPTLLALPKLIGVEPVVTARVLSVVALALIVYLSGCLLLNQVRSKLLAMLGAGAILVSFALLQTSIMAWTEPIFIVLTLLFVLTLLRFAKNPGLHSLVLVSIIVSLAALQRYVGVTLILTGILFIVYITRGLPVNRRLASLGIFSFIAAVPLAIWMIHNYLVTSTFTGDRSASVTSLTDNIELASGVILNWFVPVGILPSLLSFPLVLLGAEAVMVLLYLRSKHAGQEYIQVWAMVVLVGIYLTYLIGLATIYRFDPINDRLLSPILPFLMVLLFIAVDEAWRIADGIIRVRMHHHASAIFVTLGVILVNCGVILLVWTIDRGYPQIAPVSFTAICLGGGFLLLLIRNKPWTLEATFALIAAIWLLYPLTTSYVMAERARNNGAGGYATISWMESDLMLWLRTNSIDGEVYTNGTDALYAGTGMITGMWANNGLIRAVDDQTTGSTCAARGYLVWFNLLEHRSHLPSFNDFNSNLELEELASFTGRRGGSVSRIANLPPKENAMC